MPDDDEQPSNQPLPVPNLQDIVPEPDADDAAPDVNELERAVLQNERLRAEVDTLKQNNTERKKYAACLFWLIAVWLAAVMAFLVTYAIVPKVEKHVATKSPIEVTEQYRWGFQVSDAIILALIGSSSVNVIGLFVIVAKYLFPDPRKDTTTSGS